jgi:hypothetical protein
VQKLQGWTADPKTRKLRGLNAKNRAYLELLLNGGGLRVDSEETQGLLNKTARLKWYLLIWAAGSRSNGSGPIVGV